MKFNYTLLVLILILAACGSTDFDCPELELNVGDSCELIFEDRDTILMGVVSPECLCSRVADCPDLGLDVGARCEFISPDADGPLPGLVNRDCECQVVDIADLDCPDRRGNIGDPCRYQNDAGTWLEGEIKEDCSCQG